MSKNKAIVDLRKRQKVVRGPLDTLLRKQTDAGKKLKQRFVAYSDSLVGFEQLTEIYPAKSKGADLKMLKDGAGLVRREAANLMSEVDNYIVVAGDMKKVQAHIRAMEKVGKKL